MAAGGDGAPHQRANKVVELGAGERDGSVLPSLVGELGGEVVVLAEVFLSYFGGQAQLLLEVRIGVERIWQAESGGPVVDHGAVEVVATEVGIAVGT